MPHLFDPARRREVFDEFLLRDLLESDKSKFLPNSVGNAARYKISDIVAAWLVGLAREVAPALPEYRAWLDDSVARKEQFGDHPEYAAFLRAEAYGLCLWMLENRNEDSKYRDAVDCLERAWEGRWNRDGRPASLEQRLESIDDYLADCIQCAEYSRGSRTYEAIAGNPPLDPRRIKTAREFGYWLCREGEKSLPPLNDVLEHGERFLKQHLESTWLGHGQQIRAAAWLKIVYWHSGAIAAPLDCILKAYELMPHVKRPAFV